jgi:hypothetical protein
MRSWPVIALVFAAGAIFAAIALVDRDAPALVSAQTKEPSHSKNVERKALQGVGFSDSKPASVDYAKALSHSQNYLDFALSVMPAARAGDKEAQYRLGKALAFCDETYPIYYHLKGTQLTLDEGLQYAAKLHRSSELAQTIYDRCHALENASPEQFGSGEDWIARASSAGQPAAQADNAILKIAHEIVRHPEGPTSTAPSTNKYDALRSVLKSAIQSEDPEVIWSIGAVQGYLKSSDDAVIDQLAWWLVSCQRGYDCSSRADWVRLDCIDETYCVGGISGIDYIRNGAGAHWAEVQERAQEIDAKLNARRWDDLGL